MARIIFRAGEFAKRRRGWTELIVFHATDRRSGVMGGALRGTNRGRGRIQAYGIRVILSGIRGRPIGRVSVGARVVCRGAALVHPSTEREFQSIDQLRVLGRIGEILGQRRSGDARYGACPFERSGNVVAHRTRTLHISLLGGRSG